MTTKTLTRFDLSPHLDAARDWVGVNRPELDGEEWDSAVDEAARDILEKTEAEERRLSQLGASAPYEGA